MSKTLDRITLLETFVRIAETGSISGAARELGLSQPSVSRQLAELEARLRAQLVRRTTHSLALTDAGAELLADARQLLDGWEALSEKHLAAQTEIQGRLKVVAPVALGQQHLARIACEFQIRHPGVSIAWELEDHTIRFAETGCDCWIKVGPIPDDRLIVRRVASVERVLVGSPSLVAEHGSPKTPRAAARFPLAALDPFEGGKVPLARNGRSTEIAPPIRMRTNNIFALKEAVLMGVGIAILPTWFIADELRDGGLVDLLPGWKAPSLDVHLAHLPNRHQPARLRAFLEAVEAGMQSLRGIASA